MVPSPPATTTSPPRAQCVRVRWRPPLRSRCRGHRYVVPVALEYFHDPPDKRAAFSSELARLGIVD